MTTTYADWAARGEELGCFPDDAAQAAYWNSWAAGDLPAVRWELERIFTGPHRLPVINWLTFSTLMEGIETVVCDGPQKFVEDWEPGDFVAETWGGTRVGPDILLKTLGWELLLVDLTRVFLALPPSGKRDLAAELEVLALGTSRCRPIAFGSLIRAATAALFLSLAAPGSPELQVAASSWVTVGAAVPALQARAVAVAGIWAATLGAASPGPRPLMLWTIRSVSSVLSLRTEILRAEGPLSANLLRYLCCDALTLPAGGTLLFAGSSVLTEFESSPAGGTLLFAGSSVLTEFESSPAGGILAFSGFPPY
jgi:hypothetical protein